MKNWNIKENVDLKKLNTYGVGGTCKYLIKPKSREELIEIIKHLEKNNISWYILGGGSNVIFPDDDFAGAIIKLDNISEFEINALEVVAGAGQNLTSFIKRLIDLGFTNLTPLYGIPGSLGGAIVGNAGSFGHNIFEFINSVVVLDNGSIKEIPKENIFYEERNTEFKNSKVIVLGAKIKIVKGNINEAYETIKNNMEFRRLKQPLEYKNAGSVFKNPQDISAGKLIDDCHLKGFKIGDAMISEKHANFIVNLGNATSHDIISLIDYVKKEVLRERNIELDLEQVIVKW